MQMKVLGRISVRVKGAGMHGCQVTEPHPCPGKHGLYFQEKNMGPLHLRFKEKRLYFSRTISKNGHLFLPK